MNLAIRRSELRHGFGDLINAAYAVPQNPLIIGRDSGLGRLRPGLGQATSAAGGLLIPGAIVAAPGNSSGQPAPSTLVPGQASTAQQSGTVAIYNPNPTYYAAPTTVVPAPSATIPVAATPATTNIPAPSQIYNPTTNPNIVATANASPAAMAAAQQWKSTVINPQALLQPLPQIVQHQQLPETTPPCNSFAVWVSRNEALVMAGLAVAFVMATHRGGKRGEREARA